MGKWIEQKVPPEWWHLPQDTLLEREKNMDVSEDGTVTGSVDVSQLGEVEPKTDEAQAQLDALNARIEEGQAQADKDAADQAAVSEAQAGTSGESADEYAEDGPQDDVDALKAEAESLGVNVDGRWGAERLRYEIDQKKAEG